MLESVWVDHTRCFCSLNQSVSLILVTTTWISQQALAHTQTTSFTLSFLIIVKFVFCGFYQHTHELVSCAFVRLTHECGIVRHNTPYIILITVMYLDVSLLSHFDTGIFTIWWLLILIHNHRTTAHQAQS